MSEVIISTIKDIIYNDENNIKNRYKGDFEFNRFKEYLSWKNKLFLLIYILLLLLSIIILNNSNELNCYSLLNFCEQGIDWYLFLVSLSILLFSVNGAIQWFKLEKHHKLKTWNELEEEGIKWDEWTFKDIILKKPKEFGGMLSYTVENCTIGRKEYVLYLLCQYPDGNFGWLKLTNNEKLKIKTDKWNESRLEINHFEKGIFLKDDKSYEINLSNEREFMKRGYTYPELIVGLRIRSNIKNEEIIIRDLKLNKVNKKKIIKS